MLDAPLDVLGTCYEAMMEVPCEQRLAERCGITKGRYLLDHCNAVIVGVEIDGILAGGMHFEGGDAHLAVLRRFRGRWVRALPGMLEVGFSAFGPKLFTTVQSANTYARWFMERVGCRLVGVREHLVDYEIRKEGMRYGFNR